MKKFGFTLAEVLITLAIIGVVAALTIPTLVQNYQKKQWVSGLQKGYATLSNVFKLAMAADGVDSLTQTSLWEIMPEWDREKTTQNYSEDYSDFVTELGKYLKITKFCNPIELYSKGACFNIEYKLLDGTNNNGEFTKGYRLKIYTADGIVYYFRIYGSFFMEAFKTNSLGSIEIDVNGDNPPNQHGRDLFEVIVFDNGKLLFPGTKEWADARYSYMNYWNEGNVTCNPFSKSSYLGDYCGARVFEQGWKMDY